MALFLVDEVSGQHTIRELLSNVGDLKVHILNESRGSTLEVVISRMKARGSCVRFVMVSATVPNIADVAAWIGNGRAAGPAIVMQVSVCFHFQHSRYVLMNRQVWRRLPPLQTHEVCVRYPSQAGTE